MDFLADSESPALEEISGGVLPAAQEAGGGWVPLGSRGARADSLSAAEFELGSRAGMVPEESSGRAIAHRSGATGRQDPRGRPVETPAPGTEPEPDKGPLAAELEEAQVLANVCEQFLELTQGQHLSVTAAARQLGRAASFFSGSDSALARYLREGLAGLLPQRRRAGARPASLTAAIEGLKWFIPAAKFFYLHSNVSAERGSVPEAVRRTISLPRLPIGWTESMRKKFCQAIGCAMAPECPAEIRDAVLARERAGRELVPERIARQIAQPAAVVRMHRSPRAWSLDYLSAPGSQRRYFDAQAGQRQIMAPGDWFGGDDATPGIAVCVPCVEVVTPCSQRYGVLLGRFQWLAYHDGRTDKVLAWDYVVRPRGGYRAEDVVNGMGAVTRAHGVPRKGWQLEGGTFNANLVRQVIRLLGCEHWRTYSPHQKAIEAIFNRVWTRLAVQFPHADMGRYRAENESNCALYEACKRGQKDPRVYFPSIEVVLAAFAEEVKEHNSRRIFSEQYGQWVPDEFFAQGIQERPLRPFSEEMEWIFSPFSVERKVRGMMVRTRVPMFEDFSVPFEFYAEWLPLYDGRLVRLHFNPREPKCRAKVVLLEDAGTKRAGEVLGDAQLIGETTGHIRLIMGWADDNQRAGYVARQRVNNFMRRETRAIGAGGRTTYAATERRDGLGQVVRAARAMKEISNPGDGVAPGDAATAAAAALVEQPAANQDQDREAQLAELQEFERRNQHLFE
jgi:hypothetical protein